ncbi:MAG: MFS transporter [Alphaproteobacteria bacterium]|nr:MFS transporter [Alphaproteobacteria bacterium]
MLAGIWLPYFSFGLVSVGLAPLVEPITRDLALTHSAMGGIMGVWPLVYIGTSVPCGTVIDRLGLPRALLLGTLLVALSGFLRGIAADYWTLFLAVAVFGIGAPIISLAAPKVVSLWFRGRERGLAMGIYMTGPAIGGIMALTLSNSLFMPWFDHDWRQVLLLWSAIAVVAALAWAVVNCHPAARQMARRIAAAPRSAQRELLRDLLRLPAVRLVLVMAIGIFMFNHGLNNWLPEMLRASGMSAIAAGYWAAVPTLVGIAASLIIPRAAIPERRFAILAALFAAACLATMLLHADAGPVLLAGLIMQGIARSTMMTIMMLTLVELSGVSERHVATAGGLFFTAAEIGGATGPLVMGVLYDATGSFHASLYLLAGVAALLAVAVGWLRRLARAGG